MRGCLDRGSLPCSSSLACSLEGPVVVRKGGADAVGDGQQVLVCDEEGSPRRAGGQVCAAAPLAGPAAGPACTHVSGCRVVTTGLP